MKQCLIVDDSRTIRHITGRIVKDLDIAVTYAADGAKALEACRNTMPDVILLDWNMPVLNGIDFLKALRRQDNGETPKVVFCTCETSLQHIEQALENGADEYIMKPFDADIVESKFVEVGII